VAIAGREQIGPYRLLKLIRAGKTTHVWEALDPIENKRVALKALQQQCRKDKAEVSNLRHEHTVGHVLDHENVNRILEFNISKGVPFVVMDLFDGLNLKQAIRLSPDLIKANFESITRQSAAGLQHLHEHQWVHCDIKPDNFLINHAAEIRLIDFAIAVKIKKGLSKLLSGKSRVQGTRSYMSPEQIRGGALDARTDVYSLGCTVYELASGKLPYTGISADDLLNRHLRAPIPSLSAASDRYSTDFSELVSRMMAKKADQRPETIGKVLELMDDMRIVRRQSST